MKLFIILFFMTFTALSSFSHAEDSKDAAVKQALIQKANERIKTCLERLAWIRQQTGPKIITGKTKHDKKSWSQNIQKKIIRLYHIVGMTQVVAPNSKNSATQYTAISKQLDEKNNTCTKPKKSEKDSSKKKDKK